jgi:hypothetical protein
MLRKLVFFHTAEVHVATFDRLLAELAPGCPARHVVRADLLAEATAAGCLTDRLATESKAAMERELADPETLLLCTCSTLGPLADALAAERGRPALRVDRPMAERAVALGPRLLLAACLASTLDPTRRLLLEAAERAGREIVPTTPPSPKACVRSPPRSTLSCWPRPQWPASARCCRTSPPRCSAAPDLASRRR